MLLVLGLELFERGSDVSQMLKDLYPKPGAAQSMVGGAVSTMSKVQASKEERREKEKEVRDSQRDSLYQESCRKKMRMKIMRQDRIQRESL